MSETNVGPHKKEATCHPETPVDDRGSSSMVRPRIPGRKHIIIEDIETEGDRQMKVLLKRQLDKASNLQHHLDNKKTFTEAAYFQPLSGAVSGTNTLAEFISKEQFHTRLDELRQLGLTDDEIKIFLDAQSQTSSTDSTYGYTDEAQVSRLEAIKKKIDDRQESISKPTNFAGAKVMSRHEMELEKAISGGRDKTKMFSSLIVENKVMNPSWLDEKHPINHLDSILEEAIQKSRAEQERNKPMEVATCAPRPDNFIRKVDIDQSLNHFDKVDNDAHSKRNEQETLEKNSIQIATDSKSSFDKEDGEGRTIVCENIVDIPKEVIMKYKLTVEEIRELDKFKNYNPGIPNKTLFVKNLSTKVTEKDLVSLFGRFQNSDATDKIIYRLMTGRMKGRAFVTFPNLSSATDALDLINGYNFKGKPIIIQYGKIPTT